MPFLLQPVGGEFCYDTHFPAHFENFVESYTPEGKALVVKALTAIYHGDYKDTIDVLFYHSLGFKIIYTKDGHAPGQMGAFVPANGMIYLYSKELKNNYYSLLSTLRHELRHAYWGFVYKHRPIQKIGEIFPSLYNKVSITSNERERILLQGFIDKGMKEIERIVAQGLPKDKKTIDLERYLIQNIENHQQSGYFIDVFSIDAFRNMLPKEFADSANSYKVGFQWEAFPGGNFKLIERLDTKRVLLQFPLCLGYAAQYAFKHMYPHIISVYQAGEHHQEFDAFMHQHFPPSVIEYFFPEYYQYILKRKKILSPLWIGDNFNATQNALLPLDYKSILAIPNPSASRLELNLYACDRLTMDLSLDITIPEIMIKNAKTLLKQLTHVPEKQKNSVYLLRARLAFHDKEYENSCIDYARLFRKRNEINARIIWLDVMSYSDATLRVFVKNKSKADLSKHLATTKDLLVNLKKQLEKTTEFILIPQKYEEIVTRITSDLKYIEQAQQ